MFLMIPNLKQFANERDTLLVLAWQATSFTQKSPGLSHWSQYYQCGPKIKPFQNLTKLLLCLWQMDGMMGWKTHSARRMRVLVQVIRNDFVVEIRVFLRVRTAAYGHSLDFQFLPLYYRYSTVISCVYRIPSIATRISLFFPLLPGHVTFANGIPHRKRFLHSLFVASSTKESGFLVSMCISEWKKIEVAVVWWYTWWNSWWISKETHQQHVEMVIGKNGEVNIIMQKMCSLPKKISMLTGNIFQLQSKSTTVRSLNKKYGLHQVCKFTCP